MKLIEAYSARLTGVLAQRRLDAAYAAAAGFGSYKDTQVVLREWQHAAAGDRVQSAPVARSPYGTLAMLAAENEIARRKGELYEQRVARGDA